MQPFSDLQASFCCSVSTDTNEQVLFCFESELIRALPCCFALCQWRGKKGWLLMCLVILSHKSALFIFMASMIDWYSDRELISNALSTRELISSSLSTRELISNSLSTRELISNSLSTRELISHVLSTRELISNVLSTRELISNF